MYISTNNGFYGRSISQWWINQVKLVKRKEIHINKVSLKWSKITVRLWATKATTILVLVKTGMGKNGSEIEIQKGSNLTNPLVIGEYTLYRGSPFKIIFPLGRAFRGSESTRYAEIIFYLNLEGLLRLSWFKSFRGMGTWKAVKSTGAFEHNRPPFPWGQVFKSIDLGFMGNCQRR